MIASTLRLVSVAIVGLVIFTGLRGTGIDGGGDLLADCGRGGPALSQ